MSNRKLLVLAVVAAVMIVLTAIVTKTANQTAEPLSAVQSYLVQGLNPDNIFAIEIQDKENTIKLKRAQKGFVLTNKDNYPAKTSQINELLSDIMEIKTKELITENEDNFAELQVTEDTARNIIRFMNADANTITGVVIGKRAEGGDSYVRLINNNQVYMAEQVPWIRTSATDYINTELVDVDTAAIVRVKVTDPNGSYVIASEPNSTDSKLLGVPEGKQVKGTDYKQVFSAMDNLRFEDVMVQAKAADMKFDHKYVCELANSTVYTLELAEKGENTYCKATAEFTDQTEVVKEQREETPEELKKKEAKLLAHEAAVKFQKQHQGWVYQISSWKAKNLTKSFNELIEDIPQPEEPNTPADPNETD